MSKVRARSRSLSGLQFDTETSMVHSFAVDVVKSGGSFARNTKVATCFFAWYGSSAKEVILNLEASHPISRERSIKVVTSIVFKLDGRPRTLSTVEDDTAIAVCYSEKGMYGVSDENTVRLDFVVTVTLSAIDVSNRCCFGQRSSSA